MLTISEQQQESNITKNHTVTIVNDNHIVSHYHGELRYELKLGRNLYVKFPDIDEYTHYMVKVIYFNENLDYVLMQTESILPQPRTTLPHDGDHVLLLAYSYTEISRTLCITSGIISSTKQDKYGHIRSDCGANKGDSGGGGCFTAYGELCGIAIGTDAIQPTAPILDLTTRYSSRAHIISTEVIIAQLASMGLTKGQEPSYI
ncbi:unnamed protein product [Rotaria sp. Silwood2]|nr:unnamed protein product [Rotaria sp. Silwood2]